MPHYQGWTISARYVHTRDNAQQKHKSHNKEQVSKKLRRNKFLSPMTVSETGCPERLRSVHLGDAQSPTIQSRERPVPSRSPDVPSNLNCHVVL